MEENTLVQLLFYGFILSKRQSFKQGVQWLDEPEEYSRNLSLRLDSGTS